MTSTAQSLRLSESVRITFGRSASAADRCSMLLHDLDFGLPFIRGVGVMPLVRLRRMPIAQDGLEHTHAVALGVGERDIVPHAAGSAQKWADFGRYGMYHVVRQHLAGVFNTQRDLGTSSGDWKNQHIALPNPSLHPTASTR